MGTTQPLEETERIYHLEIDKHIIYCEIQCEALAQKISKQADENNKISEEPTNSKIFNLVILFAIIMHAFWPLFRQIDIF